MKDFRTDDFHFKRVLTEFIDQEAEAKMKEATIIVRDESGNQLETEIEYQDGQVVVVVLDS